MSEKEAMLVDGGGAVAAVYALGFVFGCSPLGVLCICGGIAVALGCVALGCVGPAGVVVGSIVSVGYTIGRGI